MKIVQKDQEGSYQIWKSRVGSQPDRKHYVFERNLSDLTFEKTQYLVKRRLGRIQEKVLLRKSPPRFLETKKTLGLGSSLSRLFIAPNYFQKKEAMVLIGGRGGKMASGLHLDSQK